MSELIEATAAIAQEAAEKIMEVYATDFDIRNKTDKSPLTKADIASHDLICAGLTRLTPDIPVLSEESAHIPYSTRKTWESILAGGPPGRDPRVHQAQRGVHREYRPDQG